MTAGRGGGLGMRGVSGCSGTDFNEQVVPSKTRGSKNSNVVLAVILT